MTMQGGAEMAGMDGEESIIDRSSAFDGVLRTARNLRVEGQAKGEIHCEGTLYVDEGAEVNARIVAANISVAGNLSGEVTCRGRLQILPTGRVSGKLATARAATMVVAGHLNGQVVCRDRLEILPSGRVSGQIQAGSIVVHEGAFIGGQLRMQGQEVGESTDSEQPRPMLQRVR